MNGHNVSFLAAGFPPTPLSSYNVTNAVNLSEK
jgi:hypothetical protein